MITLSELDLTQGYIDYARGFFHDLGLSFSASDDFEAMRRELDGNPDWHGFSETVDPDRVVMTSPEAFWGGVRDQDGLIRASHLCRRIRTEDFVRDYQNNRLFGNRLPVVDWKRIETAPDLPCLSGTFVLSAALWVHPSHRKRGINNVLPRLMRALALRFFDPLDHYGFLIVDTPKSREWAIRRVNAPNVATLSTGYYPPRKKELNVLLAWMNREQIIEDLQQETRTSEPALQSTVA